MKYLWKLMALAMVAEGITVCVAQRKYLEMWKSALGGMEHWIDWFSGHESKTRTLAIIELCCGLMILCKMKER
jgi:hypothetical protein